MKYIPGLLIPVLILFSCNHADKPLKERLISADSVAVNFFAGDGTMDTVVAVRIIRNKEQVADLATLISDHKVKPDFKCGYDGSLHFFKLNKVIQDVYFRMEEKDCMYFTFMQYGKQEASRLSPAAKELIRSVKQNGK